MGFEEVSYLLATEDYHFPVALASGLYATQLSKPTANNELRNPGEIGLRVSCCGLVEQDERVAEQPRLGSPHLLAAKREDAFAARQRKHGIGLIKAICRSR